MSKHTPGPWIARELTCEDHRGMGWIEANGRDITPYGASELWMEENRANAKLMVAAPDLLEAAERVLAAYMPQFNDSRAVDDVLVGLAAAVAKASTSR